MTDLTRDEQIIYDAARDIDIDRERVDKFTSALARLGYTLARQPAEVQEPVAFLAETYQGRYTIEWNGKAFYKIGLPFYTHPAPLGDTVSVPVEPNFEQHENMIMAGMEASALGRPSIDDETYVLSIYKAMIAAAPHK